MPAGTKSVQQLKLVKLKRPITNNKKCNSFSKGKIPSRVKILNFPRNKTHFAHADNSYLNEWRDITNDNLWLQSNYVDTAPRPHNIMTASLTWVNEEAYAYRDDVDRYSNIHSVPKKHVTTFLMLVEVELSVYKDFWHTYYKVYRPSTGVFIFPLEHFTYLVQLLYLGKLSRPKYQQKIKQNHENFTGWCDSDSFGSKVCLREHKFTYLLTYLHSALCSTGIGSYYTVRE